MSTAANIRTFIAETFFAEDYSDSDSFLQKGIIDSTGMLELVAFVEQSFGFKVSDAELVPQNLDSIDNLVKFVATKTGKA